MNLKPLSYSYLHGGGSKYKLIGQTIGDNLRNTVSQFPNKYDPITLLIIKIDI